MDLPIGREILLSVAKPARYLGGEGNMVVKPRGSALPASPEVSSSGAARVFRGAGADISRFALCFPDVYEIGMSWVGLQNLYYYINRRDDFACERAFCPWPDMEAAMRANNAPLYALESFAPLAAFDIVGFTLQYEMSYTNIVNMLDLAGIPILAAGRGEGFPVVCAGGPCAVNPEPLADFIDFFFIGEAEGCLDAVLDAYKPGAPKDDFLREIAALPGVYVPKFYDVSYNHDGTVAAVTPNQVFAPAVVEKAMPDRFADVFHPTKQLVPLIEVTQDRAAVEIFRGCARGCRFCQAGFIYRPAREREPAEIAEAALALVDSGGYNEISLVSLSTGDYSRFRELSAALCDMFVPEKVALSLPSLRVDAFNLDLMNRVQETRKSGLTFAPEAGSQRLRDVINKNLTEEEIVGGCRMAFEGGWQRVKLYFMTGLPSETDEDTAGIGALSERIVSEYYKLPKPMRTRPVSVSVSVSCFVPKPFTPFQWAPQAGRDEFARKQALIKSSIRSRQISFKYHDAGVSVVEGALARGDRRLGAVIAEAWRLGAKFDGWSEYFDGAKWQKAFDNCGLSLDFYAARERGYDETLPWDHISVGVDKAYLRAENERAKRGVVSPPCREGCRACGVCGDGRSVSLAENAIS